MKKGSWMNVFDWIWRVISANLCWIAFTILGLGVLGFFPSSVALFTIVRKWIRHDTDLSVWKTFKHVYVKEWKRTNGIGLVFYSIGLFLFVDIRIVMGIMTGVFSIFLLVFLYFVAFLFIMSIGYFFSIYVHYQLSTKEYIKQSFLFAVTSFGPTIWIGAGLLLVGMVVWKVPGLILFISGVAPAYWMMRVCLSRFTKLERIANQPS
ncbi:YesL family protein [Neobacillus sp. MM2021_6]|uniref:YesL family protein n=1 Tax=Bacillaceae TaxID=186817 RepID=UPI00140A054B|nr:MULTISPECIES: YesL family protein [Bacillaceae]MBO0958767.1 YesL family protein [Neobacillus sp. MM2021_6]NHC18139.1 YesL family protein [Bacillus sp. MM2020_4]